MLYLPAGVILQVGENLNAAVFGFDKCPEGIGEACVLLTGKDEVDVRLIQSSGIAVEERWTIHREEKGRFKMIRPDGWELRRPAKDSAE